MKFQNEGYIKNYIKHLLKKYKVWAFMPRASGEGENGIPDFICCKNGQFIGIETKSPKIGLKKTKKSELQKWQLNRIEKAGGYSFIIWNEETMNNFEFLLKKLHIQKGVMENEL